MRGRRALKKNALKPHLRQYWVIPPKHGSWLNIAEIELRVLSGQGLNRRIGIRAELEREVQARTEERNASIIGVDWQFTTKDARIKLKRLYPEFQT